MRGQTIKWSCAILLVQALCEHINIAKEANGSAFGCPLKMISCNSCVRDSCDPSDL